MHYRGTTNLGKHIRLLFYYLGVKTAQTFYTFSLNQRNGSKEHKYNNCIALYKKPNILRKYHCFVILFVGGAYGVVGALFTITDNQLTKLYAYCHTCLL